MTNVDQGLIAAANEKAVASHSFYPLPEVQRSMEYISLILNLFLFSYKNKGILQNRSLSREGPLGAAAPSPPAIQGPDQGDNPRLSQALDRSEIDR